MNLNDLAGSLGNMLDDKKPGGLDDMIRNAGSGGLMDLAQNIDFSSLLSQLPGVLDMVQNQVDNAEVKKYAGMLSQALRNYKG